MCNTVFCEFCHCTLKSHTVATLDPMHNTRPKYGPFLSKTVTWAWLQNDFYFYVCFSVLRVFGTSMVEEYEEIADPTERPDDPDDDLGKNWQHYVFTAFGIFLHLRWSIYNFWDNSEQPICWMTNFIEFAEFICVFRHHFYVLWSRFKVFFQSFWSLLWFEIEV